MAARQVTRDQLAGSLFGRDVLAVHLQGGPHRSFWAILMSICCPGAEQHHCQKEEVFPRWWNPWGSRHDRSEKQHISSGSAWLEVVVAQSLQTQKRKKGYRTVILYHVDAKKKKHWKHALVLTCSTGNTVLKRYATKLQLNLLNFYAHSALLCVQYRYPVFIPKL